MIRYNLELAFIVITIVGALTLLSYIYHLRIKKCNCKRFKTVSLLSVAICIVLTLSFYIVINKTSMSTSNNKEDLTTWTITTITV